MRKQQGRVISDSMKFKKHQIKAFNIQEQTHTEKPILSNQDDIDSLRLLCK